MAALFCFDRSMNLSWSVPIEVPPLGERKDDIPLLICHFLKKLSLLTGKKITEIDDIAMAILQDYDWPGNIRELENVIEYAHTRTRSTIITEDRLPPALLNQCIDRSKIETESSEKPLSEHDRIIAVLDEVHRNRSKAEHIEKNN